MSLLSTEGLTKHFSGLKAVENVNFALEKGEVRRHIDGALGA